MKMNYEKIGIHMMACLIGRVCFLHMYPFVVPFFLAACMEGFSPLLVAICLLLGVGSNLTIEDLLVYGSMFLVAYVIVKVLPDKKYQVDRRIIAMIAGITVAAIDFLQTLLISNGEKEYYYPIVNGLLAATMFILIQKGLHAIVTRKQRLMIDNEDFIGLFLLFFLCLYGLPDFFPSYFSILEMACFYGILYCGYRFGAGIGTAIGTLSGAVLVLRGAPLLIVGATALIGMAVGVGALGKRIGAILAYGIAIYFISTTMLPEIFELGILRGILSAGILFLMTPGKYMYVYRRSYKDSSEHIGNEFIRYTKNQLLAFGNAFINVAKGPIQTSVEGDTLALHQIGQIGEIIYQYAESMEDQITPIKAYENRVQEVLVQNRVMIKQFMVYEDGEKKMHVSLRGTCPRGKIMTAREFSKIFENETGRKMKISEESMGIVGREESHVLLEEAPSFSYQYGERRVTKFGEDISGDNCYVANLSDGRVIALLSDGMGSGMEAYKESDLLIRSLEELLSTGMDHKMAVSFLNTLLRIKDKGDMFATLDLCVMNLYSGMAEFMKLGASLTFVKRDGWVESLKTKTLPAGLNEEETPDVLKKKLYSGDLVVMISDGVMEGVLFEEKEEYLKELILRLPISDPQVIADQIMVDIVRMNNNQMKDDASVLVLAIS